MKSALAPLGIALCLGLAATSGERAQAAEIVPMQQNDARLVRIVFVGKERACNCTRKTIDASWAALQKALGTPRKLPVERLQIDTQGDKVEPYRRQKPILALPAIYFIDGNDTVVELLQGEVTAQQVIGVLRAKRSSR
jgi:uncharacterized protein (DUF1501 family)